MNMTGSFWVGKDVPGAAGTAFQKAAASSSSPRSCRASGAQMPGMDKMMKALGSVNGLAYLTEMTMTVEVPSHAEMMQQMGPMKDHDSDSITTDSISDDLFKVPEGYSVIKQ